MGGVFAFRVLVQRWWWIKFSRDETQGLKGREEVIEQQVSGIGGTRSWGSRNPFSDWVEYFRFSRSPRHRWQRCGYDERRRCRPPAEVRPRPLIDQLLPRRSGKSRSSRGGCRSKKRGIFKFRARACSCGAELSLCGFSRRVLGPPLNFSQYQALKTRCI